jgi:hypothetical protein
MIKSMNPGHRLDLSKILPYLFTYGPQGSYRTEQPISMHAEV